VVSFRAGWALSGLVVVAGLAGGCSSNDDTGGDTARSAAEQVNVAAPPPPSPAVSLMQTPKIKPKPTKGTPQKNVTWTPTSKPKIKPIPKATTVKPGATQKSVTPDAFCSPQGATGVSTTGKAMRCTIVQGDDRARWRSP
jgi:hypothetical protein